MTSTKMMSIGEVCKNASRRFIPPKDGKVWFINTGDVENGYFTHNNISNWEGLPGQAKKAISVDDILYSEIRPGNGRYAFVGSESPNAVVSTKFMVLESYNCIRPKYLYHVLTSEQVQSEMKLIAESRSGTFPQITFESIAHLELPVPSVEEQDEICELLDSIEGQINVTQKMNQILEDIAKAIFKSWFVDFDPVREKAEGRPTGLDAEISDLFPDAFEESEIGEIPAGWKSSYLAEIADIQNGYAFKSKDWSDDGEIPVIKIGNVKSTIVDVENCSRVRRGIVSGLDRFKLMRGDILIGMTGYVGEVGLVPNTREMPYLNQRVGRIMPLRNEDYGFVVALCRRKEFKSEVENLGTGSAQANVSSGSIKCIRLPLPPQNLRKVFHETASPIIDRILVASEEARCLSELRDILLPKLISGELRIPDAEKFLQEAGI